MVPDLKDNAISTGKFRASIDPRVGLLNGAVSGRKLAEIALGPQNLKVCRFRLGDPWKSTFRDLDSPLSSIDADEGDHIPGIHSSKINPAALLLGRRQCCQT